MRYFLMYFIIFGSCVSYLNALNNYSISIQELRELINEITMLRKHHCCCKVGPQGPQGPQGPPGPAGSGVSAEYAYVYSNQNSVIAPGGTIPYNLNGPITSGIIHSTTTNTDQIIVNVAGTYRITFTVTSSSSMYFAIAINGVVQTSSEYGSNTGGTILAGNVILNFNAGDILTITNYSVATTTTLSNVSAGNPRISSSVSIHIMA